MDLLIDTSSADLFIVLVDKQGIVAEVHEENLVRKSEVLATRVKALLEAQNITINDINRFYVTKGPGSFMGARLALLFATTVCLMTKAELYTASTFALLPRQKSDDYELRCDARTSYFEHRGKYTFYGIGNSKSPMSINYASLKSNLPLHLKLFNRVNELLEELPLYLKSPSIGAN